MSEPLLAIENLQTHFFTDDGVVRAVDGVSYELRAGETLAVVGESGSGKSVTALSILQLVPSPPGRIVGGRILFKGRDLARLSAAEMRAIRGKEISMIFQEPMTSLNPVYTCGEQIIESLVLHEKLPRREARARAIEMLKLVGISLPDQRVDEYPHQMSGGMRQRVMIAMALACRPSILIADEPTTALDVTIQAQILELLNRLQGELGMAVLRSTPSWSTTASMNCSPQVNTGLSEVMGSWKIIEISLPRIFLISPCESVARSRPLKRIRPATMRPGGSATRRRMESAVTLLPLPDSPTTASVSRSRRA